MTTGDGTARLELDGILAGYLSTIDFKPSDFHPEMMLSYASQVREMVEEYRAADVLVNHMPPVETRPSSIPLHNTPVQPTGVVPPPTCTGCGHQYQDDVSLEEVAAHCATHKERTTLVSSERERLAASLSDDEWNALEANRLREHDAAVRALFTGRRTAHQPSEPPGEPVQITEVESESHSWTRPYKPGEEQPWGDSVSVGGWLKTPTNEQKQKTRAHLDFKLCVKCGKPWCGYDFKGDSCHCPGDQRELEWASDLHVLAQFTRYQREYVQGAEIEMFDADGNHLHLWQWEEGPGHGYDPMGEPPTPPADTTCYWCGRMFGDC